MLPTVVHQHIPLNLLNLCLAACITPTIGRVLSRFTLHWSVLFYHQHRMGHLPPVYNEAHKFHHYLNSSTAYDAHIYGSGLPEEWSTLILELIGALSFGYPPLSFNPWIIYISWTNKVGHTRQAEPTICGLNNHVDHHEYHDKNFGIYNPLLDIFFGTDAPNATQYRGYQVTLTQSHIVLAKQTKNLIQ